MSFQIRFGYDVKWALITGASKGLGRAYSRELAVRGANLVLVARSGAALNELAATLRCEHHVRVEVIAADLSVASAAEMIYDKLALLEIELDLLVNNAAVGYSGRFFSRPIQEELMPVMVNVHSVVALTHLLGRKMVLRGGGGIIKISSNGAFQPLPYNAVYAATKSFLLMFNEALANELEGSGVRAMVAIPGATATDFFDQSPTTIKLQKMDTAESVARKTLDDFASGKTISYPGRSSVRAQTWISRMLPRALTVKLAAKVSKDMGYDR
jgi:short-subunit dehydrogenase